ncbi:hypothetical protein GGS20DRAFT_596745 [Poronia punctata]|nr:hypothetical protein GGS20DRAFT_596745 [Poronia punctata]
MSANNDFIMNDRSQYFLRLWHTTIGVQLDGFNNIIRLSALALADISVEGELFMQHNASLRLGGRAVEFIVDGYDYSRIYLANADDLTDAMGGVVVPVPDHRFRAIYTRVGAQMMITGSVGDNVQPQQENPEMGFPPTPQGAPVYEEGHFEPQLEAPAEASTALQGNQSVYPDPTQYANNQGMRNAVYPDPTQYAGGQGIPNAVDNVNARDQPATPNVQPTPNEGSQAAGSATPGAAEQARPHIPKPMNCFILFRTRQSNVLAAGLPRQAVSNRMSAIWRNMTEEQKAPWVREADELKAAYRTAMAALDAESETDADPEPQAEAEGGSAAATQAAPGADADAEDEAEAQALAPPDKPGAGEGPIDPRVLEQPQEPEQ